MTEPSNVLILHHNYAIHEQYASVPGIRLLFNPRQFNILAMEIKDEFTFFTEEMSVLYKDSIDWWVTPLASRDTFAHSFFLDVCYALYAQKKIEEDLPSEIVCCSCGLGKVVKSLIPQGSPIRVSVIESWENGIGKSKLIKCLAKGQRQIKSLVSIVHVLFNAFHKHRVAKKTRLRRVSSNLKKKNHWIIDEFVFPYSFDGGNFKSRHYVDLTDLIKANWVYLPTFIDIHDYPQIYQMMRQNDPPFIIREDFLRFNDYLWSIAHIFKLLRFRRKDVTFRAINISAIWNEQLVEDLVGRIDVLLNYRLPKRLRESSVEIQGVIDWFENQVVDKTQNMGFRHAYPSVPILGYEVPYCSEYGMHLQPTKTEAAAGIIPDIVGVVGTEAEKYVRYYHKNLKICIVPALGYQYLWDADENFSDKKEYVVVALPLVTSKAFEILNLVQEAINASDREINCLIKFHPSSNRAAVFDFLDSKKAKNRFYYREGELDSVLRSAYVFISSSSSVVLESLSKGIPVIVVGSLTELTNNPVISSVPDQMLKICYTAEDLLQNILYYIDICEDRNNYFQYHGVELRAKYFEKTDENSINRLRACLMSLAKPQKISC